MRRLIVVVAVVAVLTGLFLYGLFRGPPNRDVPSNLIGKPAPAFTLPLYERYQQAYGDSFSLAAHKGTPMVINFWASWCGPCLEEAPLLEQYYRRYRAKGVLFVGVQTQDRGKYDAGRQFISRFGFSFPVGMDNDSSIGVEYALFGVPETYFIDRSGTVVYKQVGPVTPQVMDRELGAIVP
jgi:cytochrome c biogenesis protein CcmG/thiol:disulfide interchange protein DsbE